MANEKPIHKNKVGQFEVSAWKNKKDDKEWISYQLQKSYKVGEEWKTQKITLNASDLPKVSLAVNTAFAKHYDKVEKPEE